MGHIKINCIEQGKALKKTIWISDIRTVTYNEITGDVGSSQDPRGCREENGEHRKERLLFSEIRTKVLYEDGSWKRCEPEKFVRINKNM